jgi:hypothetical protein
MQLSDELGGLRHMHKFYSFIVATTMFTLTGGVTPSSSSPVVEKRDACKESLHELHSFYPKRVFQNGDAVKVDGTWRSTTNTTSSWVTYANAVRIECSQSTKTCTEYMALINEDDGTIETWVWPYTIRQWSPSLIRATAEPGATQVELLISPGAATATRTLREISRAGSAARAAAVERWDLK